MTRVNLVPMQELTDQHLFAEWREVKMVPRSLARSLASRPCELVLARVPEQFTLNKGHVMFFYDKRDYLAKRYEALTSELLHRGVKLRGRHSLDETGVWLTLDSDFHRDYEPTPEALAIVRARIAERVAMRPGWYRRYGVPL